MPATKPQRRRRGSSFSAAFCYPESECSFMDGEGFIAEHVKSIGSSGIRRVFDLSASMEHPVNLSIGQPDFPVPSHVKQAMIHAIETDHNGYTVTRGLPELRRRIARALQRDFQGEPEVIVTSGVSGGLYLALLACLNPGDEVLVGDPFFVSYPHLVRLVGGVPVFVNQYEDFQLHPERFERAITRRTKMMIVNSPANPTGLIHREEDLEAIAALARQHDLLLISDEIYEVLTYDGPNPCVVPYAPERTLLLRGFSKSHAMTGLRIGYAAGPPAIIAQMAKLQQYTYVCAPQPAQFGALTAMDTDRSAQVDAYRGKRDLVCAELQGVYDFRRPSGGFYLFPRIPSRYDSATLFVEQAIRRNLLIIPGEVFSKRDTHFRISYAAPNETIREGCAILRSLA